MLLNCMKTNLLFHWFQNYFSISDNGDYEVRKLFFLEFIKSKVQSKI